MVTLPDLPQTEIAIVEMTNAFRKENKLGEVKPNAALTAAARAFADYLAKTGKFAHEADGREPRRARRGAGLSLLPGGGEPRAQPRQPRLRDPAARPRRGGGLEGLARPSRQHAAAARDRDRRRRRACARPGPEVHLRAAVRPAGVAEGRVQHREPRRRGGALHSWATETPRLPPRAIVTHTALRAGRADFEKAGRPHSRYDAAQRRPLRGAARRGRRIEVDLERK